MTDVGVTCLCTFIATVRRGSCLAMCHFAPRVIIPCRPLRNDLDLIMRALKCLARLLRALFLRESLIWCSRIVSKVFSFQVKRAQSRLMPWCSLQQHAIMLMQYTFF